MNPLIELARQSGATTATYVDRTNLAESVDGVCMTPDQLAIFAARIRQKEQRTFFPVLTWAFAALPIAWLFGLRMEWYDWVISGLAGASLAWTGIAAIRSMKGDRK